MTSVEFDIPQIYYGIINNNTSVIHQLPPISINSLNDIIGGRLGGQNPDKIFSCPYPAFNLEKRVAYIPIHYSYRVADETIYISACFRLKENKPLELADCQIRYRNDSNRLLNMDWCRGSCGKFILAAAIDNEPPFYEFDVTNHDELCTVNGGRLWLLKFD
jgi:hypothetical protein